MKIIGFIKALFPITPKFILGISFATIKGSEIALGQRALFLN